MPQIETLPELNFLSELYAQDAPGAIFLADYPSSNSEATVFQNKTKFIIHDPFPPPRPELLKTLGPHHLMFGWGNLVGVSSQVEPPAELIQHWSDLFGTTGCPNWKSWDSVDPETKLITLFPHQSIPAEQQVIDPETNYAIHSKEVIERMPCQQAAVLEEAMPPCIVKLSHGYAGLGNYLIRNDHDAQAMRDDVAKHWPKAKLVTNSMVENVTGDYGVQFYLRRNGSIVWLGFTEQNFNEDSRWCGGTYSAQLQDELLDDVADQIVGAATYLHSVGYFGLVGIDLLQDKADQFFLVDVNPRLTGISPFLMASRIFSRDLGLHEGDYHASVRIPRTLEQLLSDATKRNATNDCRVVVLSAFEETVGATICHLSISSKSRQNNKELLQQLLA